ncbi:hypothetical protein [Glaciibacter flavus]|uniref:hypothetical protein n=1 Tax=Orlajensenia flava TaxID=2565934 RepID=UPI003B00AC83
MATDQPTVDDGAARHAPAPELNPWDITRAEIAGWFREIPTDTLNGFQKQSLKNCWESIHRFADNRDHMEQLRRESPKHHDPVDGIQPEHQHAIYEATEAFFARYYLTISRVAALTTRWSGVFGQPPVGSMAAFIRWLEGRFEAPGYFSPLEDARRFRAVLEHPEQHQEYEWMTATVGQGPVHVVLYGPASRTGAIPNGASPKQFADGPGWDMAAPYENFVFNNTALALHACLWQINQSLSSEALSSPIVQLFAIDSGGQPTKSLARGPGGFHGKVVSFNGSGPTTIPGSSGPPAEDPITHEDISFGRG